MIKFGLTVTHNKTPKQNAAQLDALLPLVKKIIDPIEIFDENGKLLETQEGYHYELDGLNLPHQVRFYQIVPFGVTPPDNFYRLDSHNVLYGTGDEDKTGEHPRFFNWGLKRSTDYGAEVNVYLEDVASFSVQ